MMTSTRSPLPTRSIRSCTTMAMIGASAAAAAAVAAVHCPRWKCMSSTGSVPGHRSPPPPRPTIAIGPTRTHPSMPSRPMYFPRVGMSSNRPHRYSRRVVAGARRGAADERTMARTAASSRRSMPPPSRNPPASTRAPRSDPNAGPPSPSSAPSSFPISSSANRAPPPSRRGGRRSPCASSCFGSRHSSLGCSALSLSFFAPKPTPTPFRIFGPRIGKRGP
mmetsp:Transcript_17062/g.28412  ORF Transcript_17062/g.28412 Transcript_17062/m.28412 type:complete len:221 (-) Transcript_17062:15-677(-)